MINKGFDNPGRMLWTRVVGCNRNSTVLAAGIVECISKVDGITTNMQFFRFTSPSMLVKSSILINFKPRGFPRKSAVPLLVGWWNRQVAEPTSLAMALKRVKGQWEAPGNLRFQRKHENFMRKTEEFYSEHMNISSRNGVCIKETSPREMGIYDDLRTKMQWMWTTEGSSSNG